MNAGIYWGVNGQDLIPAFEEHSARIEARYTLTEWYALERFEKALIVAVRRTDIANKNHQADAEVKQVKRKAKKGVRR